MRRAFAIFFTALLTLLSAACDSPRPATWVRAPSSSTPPPKSIDTFSVGRLGHAGSLVALGFVDLSFGAMFFASLTFALLHRLRARAAAAFDPIAPLAPGRFVIAGVVEPEPGQTGSPVTVAIEQAGTEYKQKTGHSHRWYETARRVTARPFLIRREDGIIVRVIPDDRVALHDSLSRIIRSSPATRTRIAELSPGEPVHVSGLLSGTQAAQQAVYRGGASFPTLTPDGRMVISTEPPGDTELRLARGHSVMAIVLACVWAFFALVGLGEAHVLALDGAVVQATPALTNSWRTWVKPKNRSGYWSPRYAVRAEYTAKDGSPKVVEDECTYTVYKCINDRQCGTVPFLVAEGAPSIHQIGPALEVTPGWIALSVLGVLVMATSLWGSLASTRPWYMEKRVIDHLPGRLAPDA